jgi:hypothetical protein
MVILFVMTIIPSVRAHDPDWAANLDGTWKSDWQLTRKHIKAECKLSEETIRGLERLMGKMTVRYDGAHVVYTMPEIRFEQEGKTHVLDSWTSEADLNVLGRTKTQIAFLSKAVAPPIDKDSITLITFEDANTYWVYLGQSPLAGHHVREYFRRIPLK